MKSINKLHDEAMDFADQAFIARRKGDIENALSFTRKAYELESRAAELLRDDLSTEPSRSVLYRSAASLAMECGETREAERLISIALWGDPPYEIAEELRNLKEAYEKTERNSRVRPCPRRRSHFPL